MNVRASADQRRESREEILAGQLLLVNFTSEDTSSETHGIVLNISDGGMAVQTFQPLAQERTSEVRLLLRDSGLPLGQGLVSWKQQGGLAGIRLLDVSERTLADLRHRLGKYAKQENANTPPLLACRVSSSTNPFEVTLHLFACSAMALTAATGVAIAIGPHDKMECRASAGDAPEVGTRLNPQSGLSGLSLSTEEVVYSGDLWSDPRVNSAISRELGTRSLIIIPIIADKEVAGLLELFSLETDHFNEFHVKQLRHFIQALSEAIRKEQGDTNRQIPALKIVPKPLSPDGTPEQEPTNGTASQPSPEAPSPSPSDDAAPQVEFANSKTYLRTKIQDSLQRISSRPTAAVLGITGVMLLGVISWTFLSSGHPSSVPPHVIPAVANQSSKSSEGATSSTAIPAISFSPPTIKQDVGATFGVSVVMKGAKNLEAAPMQITYDPKKLQVLTVSGGDLLNRDGQASAFVQRVDPAAGRINISITRPSAAPGISGDGTILTVSFMCISAGHSRLRIDHTGLKDASAKAVPASSSEATVTISSATNASQVSDDQSSLSAESSTGTGAPVGAPSLSVEGVTNEEQHNVPIEVIPDTSFITNTVTPDATKLPITERPAIPQSSGPSITPSFTLERTLNSHTNWVTGVAFSADGHHLLSGSWDQSLKLWDVSSGRALSTIASKVSGIQSSAFSHNGRLVAAEDASNNIGIWNASTGAELRTIKGDRPPWDQSWGYSIAFSPDDTLIAAALDGKTVRLWDVNTGRVVHTLKGSARSFIYTAFSPNGQLLATGGDSKSIEIWDLATGKVLRTLKGHKGDIFAVAFSPDGRLLASASKDKTAKLWEIATGREIHTLVGHQDSVTSLAFSRNGRWLATSGWDKSVRIWDVDSGQQVQALTGHTHHIYSLAFDSGGGWLATGSEDGTIKLWRLRPEIDVAVLNEDESKRTTASAAALGRPK